MLAVFVNCGTVLLGSFIGLIFAKKITDSFSVSFSTAAGIIVLVLGMQMALEFQNIIYLTLSLIVGGLLGTLWDLDGKILRFGAFLERKLVLKKGLSDSANSGKNFARAFLDATVLFCVGGMSILGSIKAGVEADYTIIFTKSILDGFLAIVFASAMGVGTAFSIIPIFLYQGGLTLASTFIAPYIGDVMLAEITAIGGCLIIMIAINLLEFKTIKTANFLLSIFIVPVFYIVEPLFKKLLELF